MFEHSLCFYLWIEGLRKGMSWWLDDRDDRDEGQLSIILYDLLDI